MPLTAAPPSNTQRARRRQPPRVGGWENDERATGRYRSRRLPWALGDASPQSAGSGVSRGSRSSRTVSRCVQCQTGLFPSFPAPAPTLEALLPGEIEKQLALPFPLALRPTPSDTSPRSARPGDLHELGEASLHRKPEDKILKHCPIARGIDGDRLCR